jgi:hypothetical protein
MGGGPRFRRQIDTNGGRVGGYGLRQLKANPFVAWDLLDLKRVGG